MSPRQPAVSDDDVRRALGAYAALVERVVAEPDRWLGSTPELAADATLPRRALGLLRTGVFGSITPTSSSWAEQPIKKRVDWWVKRIGLTAGIAAAAPRVAGAVADAIPLQGALGASAAGLAVCAVAREHGITDTAAWIPLLAKVLLDRDLAAEDSAPLPEPADAERDLTAGVERERGRLAALGRGAQTAVGTVWQLARTLHELQGLFDERPRGALPARALAKLPVVGLAGGWLDERGGIRKAAKQTARLLPTG